MAFVVKINGVDRSDYVLGSGLVASVQRNRDWTPVVSEMDMTLSETIPSTPAVGAKITIAYSSNPIYPFYVGFISEKKYDYEDKVYKLQIVSAISKLQKKRVSYYNLHNLLASGATPQQYRLTDNTGYPSVQLLWLMDRMFYDVGIEVSLPSSTILIETIVFGGVSRPIQMQHLRVDENMLYAVNQGVATFHTTIEADADMRLAVPSYMDIVNMFCSGIGILGSGLSDYVIGFNLSWSQSGAPETLVFTLKSETPFAIDDDYAYGKETGNVIGSTEGVSYIASFRERSNYALTTQQVLYDRKYYDYDGKNEIAYPSSFIIIYEKYWEAAGNSFLLADYPLYCYPVRALLDNKIKDVTSNFDTNWHRTSLQVSSRAKEVYQEMENETAEIVQEFE